jgi:hypothetical protein
MKREAEASYFVPIFRPRLGPRSPRGVLRPRSKRANRVEQVIELEGFEQHGNLARGHELRGLVGDVARKEERRVAEVRLLTGGELEDDVAALVGMRRSNTRMSKCSALSIEYAASPLRAVTTS